MKQRLINSLETSSYIKHTDISKPGLLVYLMGPYESYPPYPNTGPEPDDPITRQTLNEALESLRDTDESFDHDEALWLLTGLRRMLRDERGVNAFLATDPKILTDEMDAATQSIAYTKASVATVFIAPSMGDNLGVGIETGAICEHLPERERVEKLLFLSERNVDSAMIDAVSSRWHVTVDDFDDFDSLYQAVKAHIRNVA